MEPVSSRKPLLVRCGAAADLDRVAEIQLLSPDAASWKTGDYLAHRLLVADWDGQVVGFIVARCVDEHETEILNLAVHPDFRRRGIGGRLIRDLIIRNPGRIHIEVREGAAAVEFYKSVGFEAVGLRREYYHDPPGNAIVMTLDSCYCHKWTAGVEPAALQKISK